MRLKTNLKLKTRFIDPVPLLDVVLIMVVFFVLATQFIGKAGLLVELPPAGNFSLAGGRLAVVEINNEGVWLEKVKLTVDELKQELNNKRAAGEDLTLVIEAGKNINHLEIVELIDTARGVGIDRIAIATAE